MTNAHLKWDSLEYLFRAFPSSIRERQQWRQASDAVDQALTTRGHYGLPALVPGLVHARLATALLAAGYRSKRDLLGQSFLCLGCHAGLEVRILRDFGASKVIGVEMRADLVEASINARLTVPGDVVVQDFWGYLSKTDGEPFDTVMALAPQRLAIERLWNQVEQWLVPGGQLVVVAQPGDITGKPQEVRHGPGMEGTMRWYQLKRAL